jgi:hypothetical protein
MSGSRSSHGGDFDPKDTGKYTCADIASWRSNSCGSNILLFDVSAVASKRNYNFSSRMTGS